MRELLPFKDFDEEEAMEKLVLQFAGAGLINRAKYIRTPTRSERSARITASPFGFVFEVTTVVEGTDGVELVIER